LDVEPRSANLRLGVLIALSGECIGPAFMSTGQTGHYFYSEEIFTAEALGAQS
jgi:hypothetical protein